MASSAPGWQRIPHRVLRVVREEGWRGLWLRFLTRTVYRRAAVFCRGTDEPVPAVGTALPVDFGLLGEHEVDAYCTLRPEADRAEILARLRAGRLCFVARYKGSLAAANWASTEPTYAPYLDSTIPLQPGEVYTYELYTRPGLRGHNIATALKAHVVQHFRDLGYRRLLAIIVPENHASIRTNRKVGYRRVGLMGYWKLGPLRRNFMRWDDSCLGNDRG